MKRTRTHSLSGRPLRNFGLIFLALLMFHSCNRDENPVLPEVDGISAARSFFRKETSVKQVIRTGTSFLPDSLLDQRVPDWDAALSSSSGDTVSVFVPVRLPQLLFLNEGGLAGSQLNDLIYLRMTHIGDIWNTRMIVLLPEKEWIEGEKFSGNVIVEDWFEPKKGYFSTKGREGVRLNAVMSKDGATMRMAAPPICVDVGYTICVGGDPETGAGQVCTEHHDITCYTVDDGGGGTGGDGGGIPPTPPPSGGGGGGGSGNGKSSVGANYFIMTTGDQSRYPKFTAMVKDLKAKVENDRTVLEALKKWSGISEQAILDKLKFGTGPEIVIKEMVGKEYGYFDRSENPNAVNISASWVRGLENANLSSTVQATSFLLAVTLLHELVHQSRAEMGLDRNYEYGMEFEKSAFGIIINRDNAGQHYYRFYGK